MKIDIFYHDKFKFSFEKDLAEIYLKRLKSIPKSIVSSVNYKKINSKVYVYIRYVDYVCVCMFVRLKSEHLI